MKKAGAQKRTDFFIERISQRGFYNPSTLSGKSLQRPLALFILLFLLLSFNCYADEIDDLIPYIIQVESSGNPYAVSKDGCIGLMQISPNGALAEYNQRGFPKNIYIEPLFLIEDLYNPNVNVKIGTWYLRRLKDHYLKDNYTVERILAAWNGGITRLRKNDYNVSKMPEETRNFVKKVMRLYNDHIPK